MKSWTTEVRIPRLALSFIGALAAAAISMASTTASANSITLAAIVQGEVTVCVVDTSGRSFNIVTSGSGALIGGGNVNVAAGTCRLVASSAINANTNLIDTFISTIQLAGATLDHSDCIGPNTVNAPNGCSGLGAGAAGVAVSTYANTAHGFVVQFTLVPLPPSLNKAFSPNVIADGGTTVLTFTVTNPAGGPAQSNVGFVDTLPTGLKLANATVGGTCANAAAATTVVAGGNTITVAALQVPAGASSCTVTVNVTNVTGQFNASCALNPPAFTNFASNVTVTNVINAVTPSCVVVNPPPPSTGCTYTHGWYKNQGNPTVPTIKFFGPVVGGVNTGPVTWRVQVGLKDTAYDKLAYQYIAAFLSIQQSGGGTPPAAVAAALTAAQTFFTNRAQGTGTPPAGVADTLDNFVNGNYPGWPHC